MATTGPPFPFAHAIDILKFIGSCRGDLELTGHVPVLEVTEWLSRRVSELTGLSALDVFMAINRLAALGDPYPLDGFPHRPEDGAYVEGRKNLQHVAVALRDLDKYEDTVRLWRAMCQKWPIFAKAQAEAQSAQPAKRKKRMTVKEANDRATKLAQKWRKAFFAMSERQQANEIGCSWSTWKKTDFYSKAQAKRPQAKRSNLSSPKAISFTPALEAVEGEGSRDEVLNNLIAEQEADREPSPLEERPRKVYSRKRL
jgi:hypothetical protein